MPVKRMRMRPWLEEKIESQSISGLMWIDKERKIFSIPWKHAARQGWDMGKDASLFRDWAIHTGKYVPGITTPDPKTWKANFRCAMRSLPDIEEVKDQSVNKGSAAVRVYKMLHNVTKNKDSKPKAKDGRRKSKGSRSHVSTESRNPRDGNQSEDQTTESSMEDETVSSTENIVSSTHQYCEEEEVPEWASSAQIISNGTDDLHFPFQVSPLHSSGFGDGETVIIEMAKELEEQMQWQQSNVDGKGFLSNEVGAADSSHSQDSIYSGAESDFKFCLTSESREGVNVFEPGNTSLTFFTAQTICCPL